MNLALVWISRIILIDIASNVVRSFEMKFLMQMIDSRLLIYQSIKQRKGAYPHHQNICHRLLSDLQFREVLEMNRFDQLLLLEQ